MSNDNSLYSIKGEMKNDDYEGNKYYFFCAVIHPSFASIIPSALKHIADDMVKQIHNKKESENEEIRHKAFIDCMSVLFGVSKTFEKYSVEGGEKLLKQYAKEQKQEFDDFCDDVLLYNVYMRVYFDKPFPLWDTNQLKEIGMFRED